jgi:hypothetical protein
VKDTGGAASLAILFGAADRFAWLGLVFLPWLDRVRVLEHGALRISLYSGGKERDSDSRSCSCFAAVGIEQGRRCMQATVASVLSNTYYLCS